MERKAGELDAARLKEGDIPEKPLPQIWQGSAFKCYGEEAIEVLKVASVSTAYKASYFSSFG